MRRAIPRQRRGAAAPSAIAATALRAHPVRLRGQGGECDGCPGLPAGAEVTPAGTRPLRRILGLGFGLALGFGSTVGVGILRLPGMVAATLGDRPLIVVFWCLGGLYALMGAVAVAERRRGRLVAARGSEAERREKLHLNW